MTTPIYAIAAAGCLRCGACSTLAPTVFAMGEEAAVVRRQPASADELARAEAALFNCPVLAIRRRSEHDR